MKYNVVFLLAWVLFSCDSGKEDTVSSASDVDYSNCRYERPEAIFYDGLPQISEHQFSSRGRGSEERFVLSGEIEVTILQYGCDYRTQEFIFEMGGRSAEGDATVSAEQIVRLLHTLSRLGAEYHVFRVWGQAIKEVVPRLSLGERTPLSEGFWVKIDQRKSFGNTTLMLTLSEKPS